MASYSSSQLYQQQLELQNVSSKRSSFLLGENQNQQNTLTNTSSNKLFTNKSAIILPQINNNFLYKKIGSTLGQKQNQLQDNYDSKEALKDWLIGKSEVVFESIINKKKQNYDDVKKFDQNNLFPSTPSKTEITELRAKRRSVKARRFQSSEGETEYFSTQDSITNNNYNNSQTYLESYQINVPTSSQSIFLPKVLDNNQINTFTKNHTPIIDSRQNHRKLSRKPSIDTFDDSPRYNTREQNKNQSQQFNQQNQNSKQESSSNILTQSSNKLSPINQQKGIFQKGNILQKMNGENSISNGIRKISPLTMSLQSSVKKGNKLNLDNNSYQYIIPSPLFSLPSTRSIIPNFSSLQHIPIPSSIAESVQQQPPTQNTQQSSQQLIQNSDFQNEADLQQQNQTRVDQGQRRIIRIKPQSMTTIPLPFNLQSTPKSILKHSHQSKNREFSLKKSVIFNEKVISISI